MAKLQIIEELAKDVAERAMQEITINDMPISKFVEKVNNAVENKDCNLTTCRYNKDRKCTNEENRKECVEAASKVLCIENTESEENQFDICETNPDCEENPSDCIYSIGCSTWEDVSNATRRYICGFKGKCKYCK